LCQRPLTFGSAESKSAQQVSDGAFFDPALKPPYLCAAATKRRKSAERPFILPGAFTILDPLFVAAEARRLPKTEQEIMLCAYECVPR
jgi:hypothetical protein